MKELEIRNIDINKIHASENQSREMPDKEELEQLAKNVDKIGLLNPITVRNFNGEYQLVAGGRRWRAFQMLGKKEIQAKVVEANDTEAAIMGIAENYHRKDLSIKEKEKNIYNAWKLGRDGMFDNKMGAMSEWTNIPLTYLKTIIASEKEKESLKSEIIQNATAKDLERTRSIKDIPDIREELLKLEQQTEKNEKTGRDVHSVITALELEPIVGAFKKAKNANISDDILKDITKLIADKKINPSEVEEVTVSITETPKEIQEEVINAVMQYGKIEPHQIKNFVNLLKESPEDIQKRLLKKEIDIEEAKKVNIFPTKEQRNQVIEERKIMKKQMQRDIERHTDIRKQQADEIDLGKEPTISTRQDIDKLERIKANIPEEQDRRMLESIRDYRLSFIFKADYIKHMNLDINKREAIEHIWNIYERCYNILIELGEIKAIGPISPRKNPVPPKKLYR